MANGLLKQAMKKVKMKKVKKKAKKKVELHQENKDLLTAIGVEEILN